MTITTYLAKNLRFLRKDHKLKQEEIGSKVAIPGATWSDYENGMTEPDLNSIVTISKFFKISLDDLILKDLTKDSHKETAESEIWKEVKLLRHDVEIHKKDIEHIKKIIARR